MSQDKEVRELRDSIQRLHRLISDLFHRPKYLHHERGLTLTDASILDSVTVHVRETTTDPNWPSGSSSSFPSFFSIYLSLVYCSFPSTVLQLLTEPTFLYTLPPLPTK